MTAIKPFKQKQRFWSCVSLVDAVIQNEHSALLRTGLQGAVALHNVSLKTSKHQYMVVLLYLSRNALLAAEELGCMSLKAHFIINLLVLKIPCDSWLFCYSWVAWPPLWI